MPYAVFRVLEMKRKARQSKSVTVDVVEDTLVYERHKCLMPQIDNEEKL